MTKKSVFILLTSLLLTATVFYSFRITSKLAAYKAKKEEVVTILDAEARLGNLWEWIPLLNPAEELMNQKRELEYKADLYYNSAVRDGIGLGVCITTFLVFISFLFRKTENALSYLGLSLVIASLCVLFLGLQSPFLELEAYMDDVTVSAKIADYGLSDSVGGRVYFFYQNHSVLELIELLYTGGNFFVAILIIFFSIVFPLVKLIASLVILTLPKSSFAKNGVVVVNKLGKWSMADVFVASIFLAFFSFSNSNFGIETGSTTLIGLHFFVAFVVLSIFSGFYLKKVIISTAS